MSSTDVDVELGASTPSSRIATDAMRARVAEKVGSASRVYVPAKRELPELTSLRGLLAWWVVVFHLGDGLDVLFPHSVLAPAWRCGDVSVDVFFMLSGFVITLSAASKLRPWSLPAYRSFLWARLSRLWPAQVAHQVGWLVLVLTATALHKPGFAWAEFDPWGFVRNLFMVNAWGVPMISYWNYPAWSVSMEWLVCLLTPLILATVWRLRGGWLIWLTACALANILLGFFSETYSEHYARILCEFWIGSVLARGSMEAGVPQRLGSLLAPISLSAFVAVVALRATGQMYYFALPLGAALIVGLASRIDRSTWLRRPGLLYMGRISYSLYMGQALAITVLHQAIHPSHFQGASPLVRLGVVTAYLVGVFICGALTYHCVEVPARRMMLARRGG